MIHDKYWTPKNINGENYDVWAIKKYVNRVKYTQFNLYNNYINKYI